MTSFGRRRVRPSDVFVKGGLDFSNLDLFKTVLMSHEAVPLHTSQMLSDTDFLKSVKLN